MPDLFTHTLCGYILLRPKWKRFFIPSIFLLGCILPDLVRGPVLIYSNFFHPDPQYTFPFLVLHAPVPLVFQAWLVSQFFEKRLRLSVFKNLMTGILVHLLLDAGQKAYHISYLWFYPFSFANPVNGLWWADNGHIVTLIVIISSSCVYWVRKKD